MKGLYILDRDSFHKVYGPDEQAEIATIADISGAPQTAESTARQPSILSDVEIILSGWGAPVMDRAFLDAAPNLRAVFYAAGSIRGFVTDEFWQRDIEVTTAAAANAIPVAEYTLSAILLSLKRFWAHSAAVRSAHTFPEPLPVPGAFGSTVGLVSLGVIGRLVRERLKPFDVKVTAYDPCVTIEEGRELGVEMASLEALFSKSDVVSIHTPWLPQTEGMIGGKHIASMKQGATLINTARGAVVREKELIAVLEKRPDLHALLDVTDPEPPAPESPLYRLPNVILTPHIAGSLDSECRRMGRCMVEELRRYAAGRPLRWKVTKSRAELTA
jgi:phosphoglycerate dehydrogenase-like enzyme